MKCLFIGTCQLKAVINVLKSSIIFNYKYKETHFYHIDQIDIKVINEIINDILPQTILIISQSSHNEDPILKFLYQNIEYNKILHYKVVNCYFTGYDPIPFDKNICHCQSFVCPNICYKELLNANINKACRKWCDPYAFTEEIVKHNFQNSIENLQLAEKEVDIIISDYIIENYQHMFLFHTYNHPTNYLIIELAKRILQKLDITIVIIEKHDKEFLGKISFPPSPSVYINLNLQFTYPFFIIDDKLYDTREAMTILSKELRKQSTDLQEEFNNLSEKSKKSLQNLSFLDNISNYKDDNKVYVKNQKVNIRYLDKNIEGYLNKIYDHIASKKFSLKLTWHYVEKELHELKFELKDLWSLWTKKQYSKVIVIINSKLFDMQYNIVYNKLTKTSTLTFLDKENLLIKYAGEIKIEIIIIENNSIWISNFDNDNDNILRS